jgi:hypothetical protein
MTPNDTSTAGAHNGEVPSPEYLHEAIRRECNDEQNLIYARIGCLMGHGLLELRRG